MCRQYRIWGEDVDGGLAEYGRVPARNLYRIPPELDWETAAAFPCAYTTAWRMVITTGRLKPHEKVLVLGAGGGVGVAAVQIARRVGAVVWAVTSGAERVRRLRELGATRVIDRREEDFEQVVLEDDAAYQDSQKQAEENRHQSGHMIPKADVHWSQPS